MPIARVELLEKKYREGHSRKEYLVNLFNGDLKIKHVYSAPIAPGSFRAGHYHTKKVEYVAVLRGKVKLKLEDIRTGERETLLLDSSEDRIKRVEIVPYIAHRLENIGDRMAEVIVLSTEIFNEKEPDSVFYELS